MTAVIEKAEAQGRAPPARVRTSSLLVAVPALAWHLFGALLVARLIAFPSTLDEIEHLSFIRWMERAPSLLPHYERMRILAPDLAHWTNTTNYVVHPSPYYLFIGLFDRLFGGNVLTLRLVDIAISTTAVALILWAGFRVLSGWRERAAFAAFLVGFPKLAIVAGMINNDNAAFLAAGVGFACLLAWQRRAGWREAAFLAFGLAFCGWTKLTVLLMVGLSALIAEALRATSGARKASLPGFLIISSGGLVGAIPTIANFARYGAPLYESPTFAGPTTHPLVLSLPKYANLFFWQMGVKWSAFEPSPLIARIGLVIVLLLASLVVVLTMLRQGSNSGSLDEAGPWRLAAGSALALIPILALHLWFGWSAMRETGFIDAAQPRYYYGLWPGISFGLALLLVWRPKSVVLFALCAGAALILLLSTPGPWLLADLLTHRPVPV
ncbi:MAG: hypothetical protein ACRED9_13975 [Caulobacteraceae bacterium]